MPSALIFASDTTVATDFHFQAAPYVWLNWDPAQTNKAEVEEHARKLLETTLGQPVVVGDPAATDGTQAWVQAHSIQDIQDIVNSHSIQWL